MHYRVIRDLGNTDLPVGSLFDGGALDARRLQRLLEQGRIAPAPEPGGEAERLAALEAEIVALRAENARLESALADTPANAGDDQGGEGPESPAPDPEAVDRARELQNHTVPELKDLAGARGITGVSSMTKPELVAALLSLEDGQAKAPEA